MGKIEETFPVNRKLCASSWTFPTDINNYKNLPNYTFCFTACKCLLNFPSNIVTVGMLYVEQVLLCAGKNLLLMDTAELQINSLSFPEGLTYFCKTKIEEKYLPACDM